ncbi:MAG: hypothetical protein Q4B54_10840 [Coriobacteriales bacterium]|nr:hypothetical protein [Coriobacteriales bacterium]
MLELAAITILMGHAGVGKTNASLGLALGEAQRGMNVTLADLDVVNPYFRSSDYPELLADAGIRLVAPVLARTTLDTPSLTGELDALIEQVAAQPQSNRLIIDVGGDDDGATTIGRWSKRLAAVADQVQVLYVVSAFRALTQKPEEAAAMLPDIEDHSHLRATGILNTSNLGDETTFEHVERGRAFAREVARLCGLPLVATVVPEVATRGDKSGELSAFVSDEPLVVMPRHVRLPWD